MAGLEEVDIPGREYLKETLTNCADPLTAIAEFQEENGELLFIFQQSSTEFNNNNNRHFRYSASFSANNVASVGPS